MLPDLSVLPFGLPSAAVPRALRLEIAACTPAGAHAALQAVLGNKGVWLIQQMGLQRALEGRREEAVGLLKTALTMLPPGFDKARVQLVLGRTLAYFDLHEQALATFGAAEADYKYFDIVAGQIEIDTLKLCLCTAHALSLCALGRAQAALTILETGLPQPLAIVANYALSLNTPSSLHGLVGVPVTPGFQADAGTSNSTSNSTSNCREEGSDEGSDEGTAGVFLRDAWCNYALARVRILLALHRPVDAIELLNAIHPPETPFRPLTLSHNIVEGIPESKAEAEAEVLSDARLASHLESLLLRAAALLALHRPMQAIAPLEERLALCAEDPAAFVLYGQALTSLGEPAFAIDRFEQALRFAPAFAPAYRYMASALVMQKLDQEALSCLRAARRIKPDWPEAWLDEAGIRLRRGELARGFAAYEWREGARHAASHGAAFWNGDDTLAGQSILVLAEQGFGDTLHFIRYLPILVAQAQEVIVEAPEKLQSLLKAFGRRAGFRVIGPADARPNCERFTLLMSLPHAVNTRMETIPAHVPYLGIEALNASQVLAPPKKASAQNQRYRVGIVPAGNPAFANDTMRSMPLSAFAPLFARNDVDAVLLQAAPREADRLWAEAHPECIAQVPLDGDFSDTAKVVCDLDLVISVDTALAHLTGAMGLPVWILLPYVADWRWLEDRSDSPWYPTARLFRQRAPRDWDSVVQQVCLAMDAF